jgi:hypothetical protein
VVQVHRAQHAVHAAAQDVGRLRVGTPHGFGGRVVDSTVVGSLKERLGASSRRWRVRGMQEARKLGPRKVKK